MHATAGLLADRSFIEEGIDFVKVRDAIVRAAFGLISAIHLAPGITRLAGVGWVLAHERKNFNYCWR